MAIPFYSEKERPSVDLELHGMGEITLAQTERSLEVGKDELVLGDGGNELLVEGLLNRDQVLGESLLLGLRSGEKEK